MKKSFRIFITALSFLLISFSAAYADEQQETEAFQDSQSFTSYSDDFLLFDSETENFTKDKDGLYNWTGSFVLDAAKMLSKKWTVQTANCMSISRRRRRSRQPMYGKTLT